MMNFIAEQFRKHREDNQRYHEELRKTMTEGFKRVAETMDRCLKKMTKALDSTYESIIVSPNTKESSKETEIRKNQKALLSENKNRKNKELSLIHI